MHTVSYTKLEQAEPCVELYIDGEPCQLLHSQIFKPRRHLPKECESEAALFELLHDFERAKARKRALYYLSQQSLNRSQLSQRLLRKGFSSDSTQFAIDECERLGYVDDREWASSFLRQLQRKRLGPSQIRLRLLAKGISAELIQELLETELRADHSSTSIQELLEGRYRSRDLRDPKERQRVASALLRKGFSPPDVWDALNQTSLSSSDSA